MNGRNIIDLKKTILDKLSKRQLKEAIELLMKLVVNMQDWQVSEKLSELETNYRYMLHYQFEDVVDTQQEFVCNQILRSLYELADDASDELQTIDSSNIFYERIRYNKIHEPLPLSTYRKQLKDISESFSLVDLLETGETKKYQQRDLAVRRERIASDVFNTVFVSLRADAQMDEEFQSFFNSIDVANREKCLFVSALTLSLFHRFDGRKMCLLIDACKSDSLAIKQRAIVGLIVVLQMFNARWSLYPECQHRLDSLSEDESFRKSVLSVVKQLIRSRETESISKKLTDEIIPEMMKLNSLAGRKLNMQDLMGETDFADKNPDWQKELEDSGLASKLQEYSSLQMEGADVFHSTFSNLKHFSFFNELSNWFLPFDAQYSELQALSSEGNDTNFFLQSVVLNSGHMCDSDKYSFAFSLLQIPQSQRQMMAGQFGQESEQMKELQKDLESVNPRINEEVASNQYIQDLYRFFKLHHRKNNFFDIFKLRLNFYDKESISPLITDRDSMMQVANYCFDKNFFAEAANVYQKIVDQLQVNESDVWQRLGYCRQMLNNLQGALDAYLQAELLSPDNKWIIKRIAQVYRSLKDPQHALEYYQHAAQFNANDLTVELNIGHCYLELGDYEKALNSYFKVELLDTKSNKAWRPIAWTAFLLRKFDMSRQYYQQLLADNPTEHDFLNAGHVELCNDKKKAALALYLKAADKCIDFDQFVKMFEEDKKDLIAAGLHADFFTLLFDELRYKLD